MSMDWRRRRRSLVGQMIVRLCRYTAACNVLLTCCLLLLVEPIGVSAKVAMDTAILEQLLNGYDSRVRPKGTDMSKPGMNGPVVVTVNILIRTISKIDDFNMEYSAQITFREQWQDHRLAFKEPSVRKNWKTGIDADEMPKFVVLPQTSSGKKQEIWMPDTFFQNEKQARKHDIDKPNVLIRIYNDGSILYSVRISLVLSCPMYLHRYPMDVQRCTLELASYAYTTDDIEYQWKQGTPIQLKPGLNMSLPSFELASVDTDLCTSCTNTGCYGCLRTTLTLQRQFSYYLIQVYTPTTMLVIVSWVSFWLDRSAVPARVTLGVTTLLTMTTQAGGINAKLPPVSYTKAIDVWINVCLGFIFGALLEFAYVTYVGEKDARRKKTEAEKGDLKDVSKLQKKQNAAVRSRRKNPNAQGLFSSRLDDDYLVTRSLLNQQTYRNPMVTSPNSLGQQQQQQQQQQLNQQQQQQQQQQQSGGGVCDCPPGAAAGAGGGMVGGPNYGGTPEIWVPNQMPAVFHQVASPQNIFIEMGVDDASAGLNGSGGGPDQHASMAHAAYAQRTIMSRWRNSNKWYMAPFRQFAKIKDRSRRADFLARFLFPLSFFFFNVTYWLIFQPGTMPPPPKTQ